MVEGVPGWQGLVGWFAGILEGVAAKVFSTCFWWATSWIRKKVGQSLRNKIRRHRGKGNVPVRSQLNRCITNVRESLDNASFVLAIQQTEAITEFRNSIYRTDDVHWRRRFRWSLLINTEFSFIEDACLEIRPDITRSMSDIGFCLMPKNQIFAQKAASGTLRDGRIIMAKYNDLRDFIDADWTTSANRARVAVFETTLYSNRILIKAINYLRKEGAEPVDVWALFDARCERDREAVVDGVPVKAAYRVDLDFVESHDVGDRKVKTLRYDEQ